MPYSSLENILILLCLTVIGVALLHRFKLPSILAYLFIGAFVGPHALGLIENNATIHMMAEVGVVFLLFMIGMEISVPRLIAMKGDVFILGGLQVAGGVLSGGLIAWWLGIHWQGALIVGGVLAMSSTAIAIKQLNEQLELHTRHGRLALSILLFQDIAVVPFLVIIPILGSENTGSLTLPLIFAFGKGIIAFALMFSIGHWLLRPLFHATARTRSIELFTLTTLMVALAAATLTNILGLSLALGAFLAGMMLAETEYTHQIGTNIRPFRDLLMGIFFISIGMQVNFSILPDIWHWVVLLVAGIVLGKGLLISILVKLTGYEDGVAIRTGTVLAQAGEFGFPLLALAINHNLLDLDESQPILTSIILSMAIAPLLIRHNKKIANFIMSGDYLANKKIPPRQVEEAADKLNEHVIICGFGRIGQNLAVFLKAENIKYIALDLDAVLIRDAWEAGESVFYGDSSHPEILDAAGLQRASAMIITFDESRQATNIIHAARHSNSNIPIIVRAYDDAHMEEMERAGATTVVPESLEASMILATHLLYSLGIDDKKVSKLVKWARVNHYSSLRGFFHGGDDIEEIDDTDRYRLHTVLLPPHCHAISKTLAELELPQNDVKIIKLMRNSQEIIDPNIDTVLKSGDMLILQGSSEAIGRAEKLLLKG